MMQRIEQKGRPDIHRRGGVLLVAIAIIIVAVIAGLAWFLLGGAAADGASAASRGSSDLVEVTRGSFNVTIPASGELAAMRQVEIRNPLETTAIITYIVKEGETVGAGDVLVRFADEEIKNEISETELEAMAANNSLVAAENALAIQESQNASNLSQARTDLEIAQIDFEKWEKGDDKAMEQQLMLAVETATKNAVRLRKKYEESIDLADKGFISKDERDRDEIAMIEADANLKNAELELEVYREYQRVRDRKEKQSAIDRAGEELERVKTQNVAELERKQSDVTASRGELENRQQRLDYWKDQFSKTEIRAPQPGLVVFASSLNSDNFRGGNDRAVPDVGVEVRRNDRLIVLPDVSEMVAAIKVHESLAGRVYSGQSVRVVCDAMPANTLSGTVLSVGVMAEGGSWRDPNRRDYTVRVKLDNTQGLGLKPSMRCKGEILLDRVEDAVFVPIQAVFRQSGKSFAYVPFGGGFAQREVRVGRASETSIEILEGVQAGEQVLLRQPADSEIVSRLDFGDMPDGPEDGFEGAEMPDRPEGMDQGGGEERRGPGNSGSSGGDPSQMISRMDANGDGMLQRDEIPEQMQGMFDRIDANGDGAIDADEMNTMRPQ